MIGPMDERTPPMTPQLALRVAIVGGLALVMFALIFFRLWFLQVLSGSHYVAEAQVNVVRDIPVAAPRGEIVDRSGTPLVTSKLVPAVQIAPQSLPGPVSLDGSVKPPVAIPAKDNALFDRLAALIGMSTRVGSCQYTVYWANGPSTYHARLAPIPCLVAKGVAASEYANVTIKTDVPTNVQDYLAERSGDFPGVISQQDVSQRKYPLGDVGAQVFGTLGPISSTEVNSVGVGIGNFKSIRSGNIVGQSGLEYRYNQWLQGVNGEERVKVNAENQFEGYAHNRQPVTGDTLKLSVDSQLEKVGQAALDKSIAEHPGSDGGAFVAISPTNGAVYAMGSAPSFNPGFFTHPFTTKQYQALIDASNGDPLNDNAVQGIGADGSTFKVITATAALEGGVISPENSSYDDTGQWCYPGEDPSTPGACLHNSGGVGNGYGVVDLEQAIQVSDDDYFYNLGYELNAHPLETWKHPEGGELQKWARAYGIGQKTGVDLPGEQSGEVPSPSLLMARYREERQCETATGYYSYTNGQGLFSSTAKAGFHHSPKQPGGCGIADPIKKNNDWTSGDNVNTAVGQGYVQLTPLQLAVVYSALANGGKIVTPHLGMQIDSPSGTVIQKIDPAPKRNIGLDPTYRDAILTGLHGAAQSPGGTSYDVMGDFPRTVYGKTGTAQYGTNAQIQSNTESDYAWYACFVPATATTKPIVVVVWVEKGGFGDQAAAPVARQILSQWFTGKPGPFKTGSSTTL